MKLLSSDVGGTFVDVVMWDGESSSIHVDKVPSTRHSAEGILTALAQVSRETNIPLEEVDRFVHGFTIATNAWLERRGARLLLLTTEGFGDVLEIASQRRPSLYSLRQKKAAPLVPRAMVAEVAERIDSFGAVVTPITDTEIARLVTHTRAVQPESIAISLLFSYLNPAHEQRLARALSQALPGVDIYCSSHINPQIEEYARANTTATAAYVGPAVRGYLDELQSGLGDAMPLMLMRSDGGIATSLATAANPGTMLLSGPAGGVIAATGMGQVIGVSDIVTFDMGGTSADFSLISNGQAGLSHERHMDQQPIRLPMIDIETISAGGGSIATVDHAGALSIGPHSAGAVPGPACYGRGGTRATLTDATLVLGMIDAQDFAGGTLRLDVTAARAAIQADVATPLGLTVDAAALGMIAVANAHMQQAIRAMTIERGHDIRRFALTAFGGAGAIFAALMQPELDMSEVLIPPRPGVFAALGLLMSDMRHTAQASAALPLQGLDHADMRRRLNALAAEITAAFQRDGIPPKAQSVTFAADMRYVGQFHHLAVPVMADMTADAMAGAFHQTHAQIHGHSDPSGQVEIVTLRAFGAGAVAKASFAPLRDGAADPKPVRMRPVLFPDQPQRIDTPVFARADLPAGHVLPGPAIVSQSDSTILVLPGQSARTDHWGVLHITPVAEK